MGGFFYERPNSLDKFIMLHLDFGTFRSACMPNNFFVSITLLVEIDVCLSGPFRIRNQLMSIPAAEQLLTETTLLLNYQRRAFLIQTFKADLISDE